MPGIRLWQPHVGLVCRLPRDYYDRYDHAWERIAVVVAVRPRAAEADVVTRTTTDRREGDIYHALDLEVGCDKHGWFQPRWRAYSVPFAAFDDPDTVIYEGKLQPEPELLDQIIEGWRKV